MQINFCPLFSSPIFLVWKVAYGGLDNYGINYQLGSTINRRSFCIWNEKHDRLLILMLLILFHGRAPAGTKRRGGPGGLNKVCGVSPELQAIVGEPALPRTEVCIPRQEAWRFFRIISCTILLLSSLYRMHKQLLASIQIVKQLWAYIRKHNLQDPGNKRKIICDDALRVVFETDCTDMFKMNKLLAKHILPLDPTSM